MTAVEVPDGFAAHEATQIVADVRALLDALASLADEDGLTPRQRWETLKSIRGLKGEVTAAEQEWENRLGAALRPEGKTAHLGTTVLHVARRVKRNGWAHDRMLADVLDTRVCDEDGVVIDETPVEKIRSVWPLAGYQARVGVLRERGLDPDDYAQVEWLDGFTVREAR